MDLVVLGGYAAMAICAVLIVWAAVRAARDRAVVLRQLIVGGVVEALIVVQGIAALVEVIGGREIVEGPVFWGYVIVALLLMPAAVLVGIAERTRWSSVALIVVAFALLVMEYRILTLWWMGSGA